MKTKMKLTKEQALAVLAALMLLVTLPLLAADFVWTGAASDPNDRAKWSKQKNWSPANDNVPDDSSDTATIDDISLSADVVTNLEYLGVGRLFLGQGHTLHLKNQGLSVGPCGVPGGRIELEGDVTLELDDLQTTPTLHGQYLIVNTKEATVLEFLDDDNRNGNVDISALHTSCP